MTRLQKAVAIVLTLVVTLLAVGVTLYDSYDIVSSNMAPTLAPGDEIVVRPGKPPSINDVVVFSVPQSVSDEERPIVSRVIAVAGQELTIVDGEVFIDGTLVAEPFLSQAASTEPKQPIPGCAQDEATADRCVVPDGFVFVMGDHRRASSDSRIFGPIDIERVRGVVQDPPFWLPSPLLLG